MIEPKIISRFFSKVKIVGSCWEWQAYKNTDEYGEFWYNGKKVKAHRISYELFKEDISEGLTIDHLCRNRKCVNPEHLEMVTNKENCRRGLAGKINNHNKKKIHCPHGHEYNIQNTHIYANGWRQCKECHALQDHQRYHKQ